MYYLDSSFFTLSYLGLVIIFSILNSFLFLYTILNIINYVIMHDNFIRQRG